jgi:hypothetical protein
LHRHTDRSEKDIVGRHAGRENKQKDPAEDKLVRVSERCKQSTKETNQTKEIKQSTKETKQATKETKQSTKEIIQELKLLKKKNKIDKQSDLTKKIIYECSKDVIMWSQLLAQDMKNMVTQLIKNYTIDSSIRCSSLPHSFFVCLSLFRLIALALCPQTSFSIVICTHVP